MTTLFLTRPQHDKVLNENQPLLQKAFEECRKGRNSVRWSLAGVRFFALTEETAAAINGIINPTPAYKGFVQWVSDAQDSFYWTNGTDVFRSPITNAPDAKTGYIAGRWESTVEHWNHYAAAFNRTRI